MMSATRDHFLGGRIVVAQPKQGFRAGLDTVLLAASINTQSQTILDLGAGVGTASLCALADLPDAKATLVEAQQELATLARQNIAENQLRDRAQVVDLDVTAAGRDRQAAGLRADHYTSVIANPPFFDADGGTKAPDATRAASRHMPAAHLDSWVKTAATSAAPGGEIIFIHAAAALDALMPSFSGRFGAISILPIASRPGEDASRVLIRGIKGSRAPLRLLPPLIIHGEIGNQFQPHTDAIFRGKQRLDW